MMGNSLQAYRSEAEIPFRRGCRVFLNRIFCFKIILFRFCAVSDTYELSYMFHRFYDTNMSHNTKEGLISGCIAGSNLFVGSAFEIERCFTSRISPNFDSMLPYQTKCL